MIGCLARRNGTFVRAQAACSEAQSWRMMKYSIQASQSASDSNIMKASAAEYARLLLQRFLATRDEPLV